LTFALLAGNNLNDLLTAGHRANTVFNFLNSNVVISSTNESCAGNDGIIALQSNSTQLTQIELINDLNIVLDSTTNSSNANFGGLAAGSYHLNFIFQDTSNYSVNVTIESLPSVSIAATASSTTILLPNATVGFTATAANAASFVWDFGDGNTSEAQNPTHTYTESGTFEVSCVAFNASCSDSTSLTIVVENLVGVETAENVEITLYPNPASDFIKIDGLSNGKISVYNAVGQLLLSRDFYNNLPISIAELSKGCYVLEINYKTYKINKRLLVK
jgi:PKD repeat protein